MDDEVTIKKQTGLNKPSSKLKVIQEAVPPEVSKLNHAVTNKKQGDDKRSFFPEKH